MCSLVLQYAVIAPAAALAIDPDVFQLDGNVEGGGAKPGDDWNTLYTGGGTPYKHVFIEDPYNGNGDKYFDQGGSKDISDIPNWLWTNVSQPQDKNDIENAYAAAYKKDGHLLVYVGLDRYASNGAGQVGFWFLQDGAFGLNANNTFSGQHQVGDVLVQIDFENGGANPIARVYEWNGSDIVLKQVTGSCATAIGEDICAIASTASTNPAWPYDDKGTSGASNDIPAGGFVESGVDLTKLGLDDGCFATFLAETRSSPSEDSTLSDFAFGNFALCNKPDLSTKAQLNGENLSTADSTGTVNIGESVTDHAVLSGDTGAVNGTVKFYVCGPQSGSNPDCTTGGTKVGDTKTISGGVADSDEFTPTETGRYCFRAEYVPTDGSRYLATEHTNQTTECFRVIPAEIKIVKTRDAATVTAGDQIGFTITVSNIGEGKAFGVEATDTLPTGFDWTIESKSPTDSNWAIANGKLTYSAASLASGAESSVHIVSDTTAADCGPVDNTASVSTTNDGSDSDSASLEILCPDVVVHKTPDNGSVSRGDTATFTIVAENIGKGEARGVVVSDNLPAGLTWTEDEADCTISGPVGSQVLTCQVGDLAAGASSQEFSVSADTGLAACAVINNSAEVSATNEAAADTANNTDAGAITVKCAIIDIEKSADDATVNAGEQIGFTVTVTNKGDGKAYGVSATDTLPAGFTWSISPASAGWAISLDGKTLTYTDDVMNPGESSEVHIVAGTTAEQCAVVKNTASVTARNDGSDAASAETEILCPDLHVTKTAANGTINAGDTASFTMTVTNDGAGLAKGVVLTDSLPSGVTWAIDPAVTGCSITAGVLTCNFGDLATGKSASVTVVGTTTPAVCGTLNNTADATATNESEADAKDNSGSASITVNCPDVSVVKTADKATVTAGATAGFTITVTSKGPGTAYGVTLNDTLPSGVTWAITDNTAQCSIAGGVLSCNFGNMAATATASVHIAGVTSNKNCGDLRNTATVVATNEPSGAAENNESTATITVDCPNITVTKTANPAVIDAGDMASFDIVVTNEGPGTATDVTLKDQLVSTVAWTTDTKGCSITNNLLECSFGDLVEDASVTVTVSGDTTVDNCGVLRNSVRVDATNEDPAKADDNTASASVTVNCPAVAITKTAEAPVVNAGDDIAFVIEVTNTGIGAAKNVKISDSLPANGGLGWSVDAANSSAGFSIVGTELTYSSASLAAGASVKARIVSGTTPATCGTVDNTATLTYDGGDGSNKASVEVNCPDLLVEKTAGALEVSAGDPISFKMTITNHGEGTAYNATLTDLLPAGIDWDENSAFCTIAAGMLSCDFGSLEAGASKSVEISGITSPAVCSKVDNNATVAASNEPSDKLTDNTDDASVIVNCPDVTISKTALDTPVLAGQDVAFEITATNAGPGTAYDVVVTDTLPAGLVWSVDNTEDCSIDAGVLTCNVGNLAKGATFTVTITAPTTAETVEVCKDGTTIDNKAVVSASNEIAEGKLPNSDSASIDVQCPDISLEKRAGDADNNATLKLLAPGDVLYHYVVTNTGSAALENVVLVDDAATQGDTSDDVTITCPKSTLAAGESMECTSTFPVSFGLTFNIAVVTANPVLDGKTTVTDNDDAAVAVPEPAVTPTPTPKPTPKVTPPPTSTIDGEQGGSAGSGLLLVLAAIAGLMLAAGYLVPARATARKRNRRG